MADKIDESLLFSFSLHIYPVYRLINVFKMIALFEEVPFTSPVFGSGELNSLFSCVHTGISYFLVNLIAAFDTKKKGKKTSNIQLFLV